MHTTTTTEPRPVVAARIGRRPAQAGDLAFLRELFAHSRDDLLLTPDTHDVLVDQRFRAHRRRLFLEHPRARHDVVLLDGLAVGRLATVEDAAAVHVVDLAVTAERRGRGIGTAVLATVVAEAEASDRGVRLLSWTGEVGVRRFYLERGFTIAASTDGPDDLVRVVPPSTTHRYSAPTAANHTS